MNWAELSGPVGGGLRIIQKCLKCDAAAEFGYRIEGEMQWFCDKHKISQNYADVRVPKVTESRQVIEPSRDRSLE